MGYRELQPKAGRACLTGCAMSSVTVGGKLNSHSIARVRLAGDVCSRLKISPGSRLNLELGNGVSTGMLKLIKAKDESLGGFMLSKTAGGAGKRHGGVVSVSELSDGEKHHQEKVPHKIKNGVLYITLPEWAVKAA